MKYLHIILLTFLLSGCIKQKSKFISFKNNNDKIEIYYSKKDSVNLLLDSIMIKNDKNNYQIINLIAQNIIISKPSLENIVSFKKDFNFDGFQDIEIYRPDLSGYNSLSNHYLFNKNNNKYEENLGLDSIYNIEIIINKKEVCSKWHTAMSAFYITKFCWQKNKLNIVESYEQNNSVDGKTYLTIIKNNKIISKDSIIQNSIVDLMNCN